MYKTRLKQLVICLGIAFIMGFSGISGATNCISDSNGYHIKAAGTYSNPLLGAQYNAHDYVGTYVPVSAIVGNVIEYDVDMDAVFTGGLNNKLNDSTTGMRSQSLRFPGGAKGERYRVNSSGVAYYTTGNYNSTTLTLTVTSISDSGTADNTGYKEFIANAALIGAKRLYFVANVQEAFARCMPDTSNNCATYASGNLDNVDPENSSVHWTTIDQAVANYAGKAKTWAGLINTELHASPHTTYSPEVFWEIGNELYYASDATTHYVTNAQYDMVLSKYNDATNGIKGASASNVTNGWKIGAVGNIDTPTWWDTLTTTYYDFAVVHSYGKDFLVNPTLAQFNCTSPGIGKQDANHPCRTTDWNMPNGAVALTTVSSHAANKKVAVTEWNTANVGATWWLDDTTINGQHHKVLAIPLIDAMVNSILMLGNYYSSGNSILQDAILWPTRSDRIDLTGNDENGVAYSNNYRSIVNQTTYAAMATQDGMLHIKDALTGSWQGDSTGAYKRDYPNHLAIFQTESGNNTGVGGTGHRYIVIANGNTSPVKIPISLTTNAPLLYATGRSAADSETTCTVPPSTAPTLTNVVVGSQSVAILKMYH